jgi:hypothetical protein
MELVVIGTIAGLGYLFSQTKDLQEVDQLDPVKTYYKKNEENDEVIPENIAGPPNFDADAKDLNSLDSVFFNARGSAVTGPNYGPQDVTNMHNTEGMYPFIGRGSKNPMYIESQDPGSFKPHKQTVMYEDLYNAPQPQGNVYGMESIVDLQRSHVVDPYTKLNGAKGQKNHYFPGQESKEFGFANGEKMTLRTHGFHWGKKRIFREPPNQRKQMYFRIGNASKAVGRFNSVYGQNRSELGHLETPYNAQTKEWYRPPEKTAGLVANRMRGNESVVLQCTSRPDQAFVSNGIVGVEDFPYSGPMGMVQGQRESMRLTDEQRDVIPNKTTDTVLWGFGKAQTEMKGGQTMNPIQLKPTHKSCYVTIDNHMSNPAPFGREGDNAALNFEYIRGADSEWGDTPLKALTDGPDVMRPPGASLNRNGAADVLSSNWSGHSPQSADGFMGANDRINPVNLRHTQKSENIHHSAIRPFQANYTTAPQFDQDYPESENRKVTPFIQRDIDPSLIDAYRQNPYTQALPC